MSCQHHLLTIHDRFPTALSALISMKQCSPHYPVLVISRAPLLKHSLTVLHRVGTLHGPPSREHVQSVATWALRYANTFGGHSPTGPLRNSVSWVYSWFVSTPIVLFLVGHSTQTRGLDTCRRPPPYRHDDSHLVENMLAARVGQPLRHADLANPDLHLYVYFSMFFISQCNRETRLGA